HIGSAAWITNQNGTAVQHLQYMAWGELFADQRSTDYSERYTFSGKERDVETGFSYFIARYYLSEYGIFGGVDQLSDKYPSTSSYAYCNNNPVMLVDPDGRKPIYDPDGNLLGTDDEGLKGKAIIMKKENFKQGMTIDYDDELNLGIGGLNDQSARDKFYNSYDNLKSRPDYDGHLTFKEAMLWFHYGNGEPLYVDQNQIDLSSVNFNIASGKTQQLFSPLKPTETGLIYGRIHIYHIGGQVTWLGGLDGKLDDYDFDLQKNAPKRNFWTVVGHLINRVYMYRPPIEKHIPYNNPVETFSIYSYKKNK
ncbi:MAG: RHS repeat-associated core domain-containing protein, partial [bacterium]